MSAKRVLLAQFDLHNKLYNTVIDSISDDEANLIIAEPMNSIKWLAGHLLWAQAGLAYVAAIDLEVPWRDHFCTKEGGNEEDFNAPESKLPTLEEIQNKWNEVTPLIRNGLDKLSDEALNRVMNEKEPIPVLSFDHTLAGSWTFINHHQAYTIGQIGILRRGLGKAAMKYS